MNAFLKIGGWLKRKMTPENKGAFEPGEFSNAGLHYMNDAEIDPAQMMLLDRGLSPKSPEIKNIAITGPYGSGKSSLIHSYLASHSDLKSATVTLGAFTDSSPSKGLKDRKAIQESPGSSSLPSATSTTVASSDPEPSNRRMDSIEKKIVDQLAARAPKKKYYWSSTSFPSSAASRHQRLLQYVFLALLVLSAITAILLRATLASNSNQIALVSYALLFALVFTWIIFSCIFVKSGCPPLVKQLSLSNAQMTMDHDLLRESYFDRNIALILQIIDDLNADVIVFEDIDRLNEPDLFTKLRELNQVVNSHVGADRTIKFVYCLRDTVFKGKERVKFFDLIIPVVPILDGFNSLGALNEELGNPYRDELDDRFRRNVAMYLDDYRLIKNTVVEYKVYYSKLDAKSHPELVKENLFAIIALKNLHAELFHGLEARTGSLYDYLSPFEEDSSKECSTPLSIREVAQSIIEDTEPAEALRVRDFLIYIIEEGYLDSSFFCYISLPDSDTISLNDRAWLLDARKGVQNLNYELQSPSVILLMSKNEDFGKQSFLNVSLLEYAIGNGHLSSIARSMMRVGKTSSPEFVSRSVDKIPSFAYQAYVQDENYFKPLETGISSLAVALSIVCHTNQGSLDEANNALEETLAYALSENIGRADSKRIKRIVQAQPDALKKIILAMVHYESRCKTLRGDIDQNLFDAIIEDELLAFNESNLRYALSLGGSTDSRLNPLDRARNADSDVARKLWSQICAYPKRFVDEYIDETKQVICSPDCFIELLNCFGLVDTQSAVTFIESFRGQIEHVNAIECRGLWPSLEKHHKIKSTLRNALECLKEHGATEEWEAFVNESAFSSSETKINDGDIDLIRMEFPSFYNLNDDRFQDFCKLSGENSVSHMDGKIGTSKADILLSNDALILSPSTLDLARQASETVRFSYFSRHPEQYCEAVTQSGSRDDSEAIRILDAIEDDELTQLFSECISRALESVEIKASPSTLGKLLCMNKFRDPAAIVARYGADSKLDPYIEEYACSQSASTLSSLGISVNLAIRTLERTDDDQVKAFCMSIVSNTNEATVLIAGLKALGSEALLSLTKNKQPLMNALNPLEQSVTEDLIKKGWVTKGHGNGRLYGRKLMKI